MKIEAAQIEMRSQHNLSKTSATQINFADVFNRNMAAPRDETGTDIKSLITELINELQEFLANRLIEFQRRCLSEHQGSAVIKVPEQSELKEVLDRLLELLSGKQIPYEVQNESPAGWLIVVIPGKNAVGGPVKPLINGQPSGFGRQDFYQEIENLTFTAKGTVTTADHRQIKFETELEQHREYESHGTAKASQAKFADPLVLNFNSGLATVTSQKYDFDIDSDGKAEQITMVSPESGVLALDLDHDQKITRGQELFGPSTGNGFGELTKYDADHNGWIDSADPIFQELKLWNKDTSGKDQLSSLAEKGVGAIYLENISAPFEHKDLENQLLGWSRQASIYLREDGSAGSVQQIEFTV